MSTEALSPVRALVLVQAGIVQVLVNPKNAPSELASEGSWEDAMSDGFLVINL